MSTELQVLQSSDGFSVEQQKMLEEKLQERNIKERKGTGGKMLKYVSGDYAISTANRIFGFGKWGYRVLSKSREQVGDEEFYTADIELYVIGCPFPFPGEGVGTVKRSQGAVYATVEQHEKARKEAVTDALKRALRHYGDQFGLSLYNEDNWIEADDGTDKRVKDVGKHPTSNGYNKPAPKVVDAAPEPVIENLKQVINSCRNRAYRLGLFKTVGDYERYCQKLIGKNAPETVADVNTLNADMAAREKKAS